MKRVSRVVAIIATDSIRNEPQPVRGLSLFPDFSGGPSDAHCYHRGAATPDLPIADVRHELSVEWIRSLRNVT